MGITEISDKILIEGAIDSLILIEDYERILIKYKSWMMKETIKSYRDEINHHKKKVNRVYNKYRGLDLWM